MTWNDIMTALGTLLAFFGGATIIANGIKAIKDLIPMTKITKQVEDLEKRTNDIEQNYKQLHKVINAQSKLLIEMTTHMITGNDIEALKERRDELTDSMIEEVTK